MTGLRKKRYNEVIQPSSTERMSEDIKYSICATHYNNIHWLPDSVEVILNIIEGRSDWELVITDAGSTDGSLERLQELSEENRRFKLFVEEGINIGEGRQLAVEKAQGDILIQLGDLDAEYYRDNRIISVGEYYSEYISNDDNVQMNVFGGVVVDKNLIQKLGGWKDIPVAEERELNYRAFHRGKLIFLDFPIVKYNAGENKATFDRVRRTKEVYRAKMNAGVTLRCLAYLKVKSDRAIIQRIAIFGILIIAFVQHKLDSKKYNTYKNCSPAVESVRKYTIENDIDVWIETPPSLEHYEVEGQSLRNI